jgi:hypothetical protein
VSFPEVTGNIGSGAFYCCYALQAASFPEVTGIGDSAFGRCYALQAVSFPEVTGSIGDYAFRQCYALQAASFPEVTGSIGSSAFAGCFALQAASFPKVTGNIGSYAFGGCYALRTVIYPQTATVSGDSFSGCHSDLKRITTNFSSYLGWDLISPRSDDGILTLNNASNVSENQLNGIRHLYLVGNSKPDGLNISTRNKLLSLTFTNCANLLETQ